MTGPSASVPMPGPRPGAAPGPVTSSAPSPTPAAPIPSPAQAAVQVAAPAATPTAPPVPAPPVPAPPVPAPPQQPGEAVALAARDLLRDVDSKPVAERIEVFTAVHERLQRALTQIDSPGQ